MSAVQPNWSKLSGALKQDMIGSPGDAHAEELAPAPARSMDAFGGASWLMRDTKCVIARIGHTRQCDRCDRLRAACVGVTPLDAQFDECFPDLLRRQPGSSGNCGWRKSTTERIAARRVGNLWG